ncbi:MAG: hypothetical protein ABI462_03110 [Ignavibacteria bacterium]
MDGVSYITDEKGKKNAVVIDLKMYSKIWEDIYDSIIADDRVKEPKESYESVKQKLKKRFSK